MRYVLIVCLGASIAASPILHQTRAEETLHLKQLRTGPAKLLTTAELETLGDPFFTLVLERHADVTNLKEIEDLLQPNASARRVFVVDENIANPNRDQSRRSVIAFRGKNPPVTGVALAPNVMLSVFFDSEGFPDTPTAIEAWGWDNQRGRYNYYKLDDTGTPGLQLTWKFRGSSVDVDLLNASERQGTCFMCHVSGAPIMKELALPWNNWRSAKFPASYMTQDWPVGSSLRLQNLVDAEELETQFIISAIEQFNTRRLNHWLLRNDADGNIKIDANGNATVVEGRRLLRHLFATTEVNLVSSDQLSGMHPFAPDEPGIPAAQFGIPDTFFLNANLIAGGTNNYQGLGIADARKFSSTALVQPTEYRRLIEQSGVTLGGRAGDANFAWFVPEPSHVDNSMVDRLMRRGVLTREFVASVLAIDLERPIFSEDRASLLQFIPEKFSFKPATAGGITSHPDELTLMTIDALAAANPVPGSAAADFLSLLRDPDPMARLRERVADYLGRVSSRLQSAGERDAELQRLFERALDARIDMKQDPVLSALDETGDRLFPLP